jgi:hypothetical protein
MDNAPTPSHHIPCPDDAAVSVRLAAIEEHLDEIIRRLDEMKNLVTRLDHVEPKQ